MKIKFKSKFFLSATVVPLLLSACSDGNFTEKSCENNLNSLKRSVTDLELTAKQTINQIDKSKWVFNKDSQISNLNVTIAGSKSHLENVNKMKQLKEFKWCNDFSKNLLSINIEVDNMLKELNVSIDKINSEESTIKKSTKCKLKKCDEILNEKLNSLIKDSYIQSEKIIAKENQELNDLTVGFSKVINTKRKNSVF